MRHAGAGLALVVPADLVGLSFDLRSAELSFDFHFGAIIELGLDREARTFDKVSVLAERKTV